MAKLLRYLRFAAIGVLLLIAALLLSGYWTLRSSLPALEGTHTLAGLAAPVSVERDGAGVPTLRAANRADLARALGFLHAQDRFFQMDLLRRVSAGELSALLGAGTVSADRGFRVHRFRSVAHETLAHLSAEERALAQAYAAGVNAGLAALKSPPFEYWLLNAAPEPWLPEDSLLVAYTMYLDLQDSDGHPQLQQDLLRASLPDAAFRFVTARAPAWESTLDGSRTPDPVLPPAADFDLRAQPDLEVRPPVDVLRELGAIGSNNWAVAGSRTTSGAALVADDMHLNFRVPTIWYRVRMISADAAAPLDITGVTLPGTPCIVAGSNGHIAWGFTDSYGEYQTLVRLEPVAGHDAEYATPAGGERIATIEETLRVHGAPPVTLKVEESRFGPVVAHDWNDRRLALAWTAYDPAATNLGLVRLERAQSVAEAVQIAPSLGIPGQNLTVGDAAGHIGWTIAGRIALHAPTGGLPQSSLSPDAGLTGWLDPADWPRVVDPQEGAIWTANARVVGGEAGNRIGDLGTDRGARASQIHADLAALKTVTPRDSLAIQLDDRSVFLERWKTLLDATLGDSAIAGRPDRAAMREVLGRWSGHAAVDDPAYRLVRRFRGEVEARAFYMLVAPARAKAPGFRFVIPTTFEGPLWLLLEQRPPHLLAARYASWDSFLLEAADAAAVLPSPCKTLLRCTWGTVHVTRVAHPLTAAVPGLAGALNMPDRRIPGDRDMPRVIVDNHGASERFSVSPGHESEAYFHMPGGQSGHPLSPYYRAGFDAWVTGEPTPFLPGSPVHTLTLAP